MSLLQTMTHTSEQQCELQEIRLLSCEGVATPCWTISYFKMLIRNSSGGMRHENWLKGKRNRRNRDKNVLFDFDRGEISLPAINVMLHAPNEPVSLYWEQDPWGVHGLQSCFPGLLSLDHRLHQTARAMGDGVPVRSRCWVITALSLNFIITYSKYPCSQLHICCFTFIPETYSHKNKISRQLPVFHNNKKIKLVPLKLSSVKWSHTQCPKKKTTRVIQGLRWYPPSQGSWGRRRCASRWWGAAVPRGCCTSERCSGQPWWWSRWPSGPPAGSAAPPLQKSTEQEWYRTLQREADPLLPPLPSFFPLPGIALKDFGKEMDTCVVKNPQTIELSKRHSNRICPSLTRCVIFLRHLV